MAVVETGGHAEYQLWLVDAMQQLAQLRVGHVGVVARPTKIFFQRSLVELSPVLVVTELRAQPGVGARGIATDQPVIVNLHVAALAALFAGFGEQPESLIVKVQ